MKKHRIYVKLTALLVCLSFALNTAVGQQTICPPATPSATLAPFMSPQLLSQTESSHNTQAKQLAELVDSINQMCSISPDQISLEQVSTLLLRIAHASASISTPAQQQELSQAADKLFEKMDAIYNQIEPWQATTRQTQDSPTTQQPKGLITRLKAKLDQAFIHNKDFAQLASFENTEFFASFIKKSRTRLGLATLASIMTSAAMAVFPFILQSGVLTQPTTVLWTLVLVLYAGVNVLLVYSTDKLYQFMEKYLNVLIDKLANLGHSANSHDIPSAFYIAIGEASLWYTLCAFAVLVSSTIGLGLVNPLYLAFYLPLAILSVGGIIKFVKSKNGIRKIQNDFISSAYELKTAYAESLFSDQEFDIEKEWKNKVHNFAKRYHRTNTKLNAFLALVVRIGIPVAGLAGGFALPALLISMALEPLFTLNINLQSILESVYHTKKFKELISKTADDKLVITPRKWNGKTSAQVSQAGTPIALSASGLSLQFGNRKILENQDFFIHKGENLSIIAPSGTGKSCLAQILGFEINPDKGTLNFHYENQATIQASPKNYSLDDIKANVRYHSFGDLGSNSPVKKLLPQATSEECFLNTTQQLIPGFGPADLEKSLNSFSTGEKTRIKLAMVLSSDENVPFIILDEPFSGLDSSTRQKAIKLCSDFQKQHGNSFIFIDHSIEHNHEELFANRSYLWASQLCDAHHPGFHKNLLERYKKESALEPSNAALATLASPVFARFLHWIESDCLSGAQTAAPLPLPGIVAHRAANSAYPTNTIQAINQAQSQGVEAVEIDLRLCADGTIVLAHDAFLEEVSDSKGCIEELDWKQIEKAHIHGKDGNDYSFSKLEDVFEKFKDSSLTFVLDLKPDREWQIVPELGPAVARMVEKYKLEDRVVVSSFYPSELAKVRQHNPDILTTYIVAFYTTTQLLNNYERLAKNIKKHNLGGLHLPYNPETDLLTRQILSKLSKEFQMLYFTTAINVDNLDQARDFLEDMAGVFDYISVDNPGLFVKTKNMLLKTPGTQQTDHSFKLHHFSKAKHVSTPTQAKHATELFSTLDSLKKADTSLAVQVEKHPDYLDTLTDHNSPLDIKQVIEKAQKLDIDFDTTKRVLETMPRGLFDHITEKLLPCDNANNRINLVINALSTLETQNVDPTLAVNVFSIWFNQNGANMPPDQFSKLLENLTPNTTHAWLCVAAITQSTPKQAATPSQIKLAAPLCEAIAQTPQNIPTKTFANQLLEAAGQNKLIEYLRDFYYNIPQIATQTSGLDDSATTEKLCQVINQRTHTQTAPANAKSQSFAAATQTMLCDNHLVIQDINPFASSQGLDTINEFENFLEEIIKNLGPCLNSEKMRIALLFSCHADKERKKQLEDSVSRMGLEKVISIIDGKQAKGQSKQQFCATLGINNPDFWAVSAVSATREFTQYIRSNLSFATSTILDLVQTMHETAADISPEELTQMVSEAIIWTMVAKDSTTDMQEVKNYIRGQLSNRFGGDKILLGELEEILKDLNTPQDAFKIFTSGTRNQIERRFEIIKTGIKASKMA